MIDEYWTFRFYGYYSYELKPKSCKPIVARCDGCCQYKITSNNDYHGFCGSCSQKGKKRSPHTEETRRKISESKIGKKRRPFTDKALANMSKAQKGRLPTEESNHKMSESRKGMVFTDEHRKNLSEARTGEKHHMFGKHLPEETKRNISAAHQHIAREDWTKYISDGEYCHKFDEECRERCREKYDRKCFICNKTENDNKRKLSVHHIDLNKLQGCDDHEWNLIPLCLQCHGRAHSCTWISRIEYLLEFVWI